MIEFSAYLAAQRLTQEAVQEALPDAPVREEKAMAPRYGRGVVLRQRISVTLRRLADLVEPCLEPARPAVAGCQ